MIQHWEIIPAESNLPVQPHSFGNEVLLELQKQDIWPEKLISKLWELLDAKTLTESWLVKPDNQAQLSAWKSAMQLYGMKTQPSHVINIFNNIPSKDDKLTY